MRKSEICRLLSEKLEPRPFFDMPPYPEEGELLTSNDGFWTIVNDGIAPKVAVDYFESEDASAKLLEAMPEPELWLESRKDEKFRLWACWADLDGKPEDAYAHHADRKTAIVLAAMGWLGIEGEISE